MGVKEFARRSLRCSEKAGQFTEMPLAQKMTEQKKKISMGRAWKAEELRLKSTEDLHRLWYVLLKEKNLILSDNVLKRKIFGSIGQQGRYGKVKRSMARLLTVITERERICQAYRKKLEDDYVAVQRAEYDKLVAEEEERKRNLPRVPEITYQLIRAKFKEMDLGKDNIDYIKKEVERLEKREAAKKDLDERFNYQGKVFLKPGESPPEGVDPSKIVQGFSSGILEQLRTGRLKISQEEVLRSHVKNWKMLSLKDRRVLLGMINARRAKDAKSEFLKELNLLGQKIAYDNMQSRSAPSS
eukprot:TRINITY_DN1310_c0_g1_i4.p2 TRINITY_DN1310_c0_g1~~TRINITY_DN1310_c0_g1_i4.p2  ORF type:complete len:299 (-),score=89.76 TRINITY_DN1310_c0_g1_i4:1321-2217(-)